MGIKQFGPMINTYIEHKQQMPLRDPILRDETNRDLNFIGLKI